MDYLSIQIPKYIHIYGMKSLKYGTFMYVIYNQIVAKCTTSSRRFVIALTTVPEVTRESNLNN